MCLQRSLKSLSYFKPKLQVEVFDSVNTINGQINIMIVQECVGYSRLWGRRSFAGVVCGLSACPMFTSSWIQEFVTLFQISWCCCKCGGLILKIALSVVSGFGDQALNDLIQDESKPPQKKFYENRLKLLEDIGWSHWAAYERKWLSVRFPSSCPLF